MKLKRMMKSIFPALITCLLLAGHTLSAAGPRVVATTTMVTDLAQRVGGDRVTVSGLMGPGVDPHLFKPAGTDIAKLSRADVILYNGLYLEGRMSELFENMGRRGKKVYAVTRPVPAERLEQPEDFDGHPDPHVWGDPELWTFCVDEVVRALTAHDPEGGEIYAANAAALKQQYKALREWAVERVKLVPEEQRILITSHDAFGYFGRAFGFQVIGVQGLSTVNEAGLADIAKIADYIKDKGVKAIFVESSVSPATIERISKDAGVSIGGELFSDALGTPGEMETVNGETYDLGTYEGWIKHNINTVVEALK